jgi:hypothetical protein
MRKLGKKVFFSRNIFFYFNLAILSHIRVKSSAYIRLHGAYDLFEINLRKMC